MNYESKKNMLNRMLKNCPEILTPMKASKWAPIGKNAIYAAIRNKEIESFIYRGGYIITKEALIDYLVKTSEEQGRTFKIRGDKNDK